MEIGPRVAKAPLARLRARHGSERFVFRITLHPFILLCRFLNTYILFSQWQPHESGVLEVLACHIFLFHRCGHPIHVLTPGRPLVGGGHSGTVHRAQGEGGFMMALGDRITVGWVFVDQSLFTECQDGQAYLAICFLFSLLLLFLSSSLCFFFFATFVYSFIIMGRHRALILGNRWQFGLARIWMDTHGGRSGRGQVLLLSGIV